MRAELEHASAQRGERTEAIERAQALQQILGLGQRARRRRIDEGQIITAPGAQLQQQTREFDLHQLGPARGLQALALRPQAVADARRHAARATGALIGRGLADVHCHQLREAGVRVEARLAREAGIDHGLDARQGHAALGHIGGEHDAATAVAGGLQHGGLLLHRQLTVERQHLRVRGLCGIEQQALAALDLAQAGQEDQQVAVGFAQGELDRAFELGVLGLVALSRRIGDAHGMAAAGAGEARGVQRLGQALAVERGRHHHDAQIGPQLGLHFERERETEVSAEMALVELVEDQRADAVEQRVVLQHAGEDAFGDHLDAGARTDLRFEADAVADRLAGLFTACAGHEVRGRARGDAARLQHQQLAACKPGRVQQGRRHARGLAGAGRGLQHQTRLPGQADQDLGQQGINRKRVGHGRHNRQKGKRRRGRAAAA